MSRYKIGVLVGSVRTGSYSQALARAAVSVAPESLTFTFIPLAELPLFNQDRADSDQPPQEWASFRESLEACDGFLFVTPEYNRSIPALMKNAIDVGSRPTSEKTWAGKPGAILAQSPGHYGGLGAVQALRQALVYPNVICMNQPEGYFGDIAKTVDPDSGEITDERALNFLRKIMDAFSLWVERIR